MESKKLLDNFDIDNLDVFEMTCFNHNIVSMIKRDALQIIINDVEGDLSQLSESLREIAELQEEELLKTNKK